MCILESVFDIDKYSGVTTQGIVFGNDVKITEVDNDTLIIKALDKRLRYKFDCDGQAEFDELYHKYYFKSLILDCEANRHSDWGAVIFGDSPKWDFHGVSICLPNYGKTRINANSINNLVLNIEKDGVIDGDLMLGIVKGKSLELKNCDIECYRLFLSAKEYNLKNTIIVCRASKEGCYVDIDDDSKEFEKLIEELINENPIKDPLKRFGLEGLISNEIILQTDNFEAPYFQVVIARKGKSDLTNKKLGGNLVPSTDGKFELYLLENEFLRK